MRQGERIDAMIDYLWHFVGLPYRWGGDDPMAGFDCSGLAVEGLQSVGIIPRVSDFGAGALHGKFPATTTPLPGCLAYWHDGTGKIIHVEIVIDTHLDGLVLTIGASGGGSETVDLASAIKANAYIKVRPVNGPGSRANFAGYNDPFAT